MKRVPLRSRKLSLSCLGAFRVKRALLLLLLFMPSVAWAQKVVLIVQENASPMVLEALHRLEGELKVHDFHTVFRRVDDTAPLSPERLASIAEEEGAVASVAFVTGPGHTSADVWLSDQVTGKTSIRTLNAPNAKESPSVLAIRAVDLLRLSLRELSSDTPPPPEVVGAHPERAPAHVRDWARKGGKPHPWQLRVEATAMSYVGDFDAGVGVAVSFGRAVTEVLHVRAVFAGPTQGGGVAGPSASANLRHMLGQVELALVSQPSRWARLELTASAGLINTDVVGKAETPYIPESGSILAFAGGAGFGAALVLTPEVAIGANLRGYGTTPTPTIDLGDTEVGLGPVVVQGNLGLQVSF